MKKMRKTIPRIMLEDHGKINHMIQDFITELEKHPENHGEIVDKFFKFKWNLEKHFFVEEKVIFNIYASSKEEESEEILRLLKEHKNMLWLIERIEEDLEENHTPRLGNLTKTLNGHINFENQILYPRLEEELGKNEKKLIVDRMNEVVI